MRSILRAALGLLLLACLLSLCACGASAPAAEETPAPSAVPEAQPPAEEIPAAPVFTAHVPFLFPDERGFIRPDAPLCADELTQALAVLAPSAQSPGLSAGGQAVTAGQLRDVLAGLLGAGQLPEIPGEGEISRADFAVIMTGLMGTGTDETVQVAEGALAPVDLPADAPYYAAVLEACAAHEPGGELGWAELALDTGYEPGPFLLDGRLYCCGEDGRLLKNTSIGPLSYDENGRYTSGDAELDGYVTEILAAFCAEHPEEAGDRLALLRRAYDYAMTNFHYVGRSSHTDEEGWELRDGKLMLETGRGDCYDYTAGFVVLARGLGFPANGVIRSLDTPENLHAWTDIVIDGTPYIFDPQLEKHFKNNRFMLTYKDGAKYGYRRPFDTPGEVTEAAEDLVWIQPTQRGELVSATGENGLTYLVYLPYGYDESKQYNVLVYPYGADGDPYKMLGTANTYSHQNRYFGRYITTPAFIDYLVERGDCDGLIFAATNTARADGQSDRYISLIQYVAENFSTYAASSSIEDLIAAREHFGIAGPSTASQSICICLKDMPDVFGTIGLFSGISRLDEAVEAMAQKQHVTLVMGVGDQESALSTMKTAYEQFSALENVDASLTIFPNSEHEWSTFDSALRELLFSFSPKERNNG